MEMDTDSNFLGITAENVEDLIKPELKEQFEREKHNWFVTPLAPKKNVLLDSLKSSLKETK